MLARANQLLGAGKRTSAHPEPSLLLVDDSALNLRAAAAISLPGIRFTSADALARDLAAP